MSINLLEMVYQAILNHDTRFDGIYYVGIKSTGIFCRPSCRSRTPNKQNIIIFESIEKAQKGGFRACKRCKPDDPCPHGPDRLLAERVKDLVCGNFEKPLTLAVLAGQMNISPCHMQRVFKRATGTTPARYLHSLRLDQARTMLRQTDLQIRDIAFKVGFRSTSHFSSAFQKATGLTPSEYRNSYHKEQL